MAQTKEGAEVTRAKRFGVPVDELRHREASGEKFCYSCRVWKSRTAYHSDRSRYDGLAALCLQCKSEATKKPAHLHKKPINPVTGKPGPAPKEYVGRDGDKVQARMIINLEVSCDRRPHADTLPCSECGHIGEDKRHEYHHHRGYAAEHHQDVVVVCSRCHSIVEGRRKTHCIRGHALVDGNLAYSRSGKRQCLECRRLHDRGRRDAAYWREYRSNRKRKLAA